MSKKVIIAAALTLFMSGPAFSDTPIGKGVTGAGGTGPNEADVQAKAREAKTGRADGLNPDGSEPSGRNAVRAPAEGQDGAKGTTGRAGASGGPNTMPEGTVRGGAGAR